MLMVEKNYKNLQEEVDELRGLVKKLRVKYKDAIEEIKDLQEENQIKSAEMIDTIREQNKELGLLKQVVSNLITDNEMDKIKTKSAYSEESQQWEVPFFILKLNDIQFPKIKGKQQSKQ
jgi:chromosome segregation ATPase